MSRLSASLLDDAKVQTLRPALFKAFINLSLYHARHGSLGSIPELAWALHMSPSAISHALEDLVAAELVENSAGVYRMIERRAKKKRTADPTAAQRMRRHRERKTATPAPAVTVPVTVPVTVGERNVTGISRVTPELVARSLASSLEEERETVEAEAKLASSPQNAENENTKAPKKPPEAETGLLDLVWRLTKHKLNPPPERLEADLLGASPTGLKGVLEAFRAANLENRNLAIESYGYFVTIVRSHFRGHAAAARAS